MSSLFLVRHGQARAFDVDSDRLSDLGAEQARLLGEYWARAGVSFDAVWSGTLGRQTLTAELVAEQYRRLGKSFPDIHRDPAWNEYDAGGVLGTLAPKLAAREPSFAALVEDFQTRADRPDRNRYFQRMFEVLMKSWAEGLVADVQVESFDAFHERVRRAFDEMTSSSGRGRVVVFTSGGPIGVGVQRALDAPPMSSLRLNWRVKNASVTEFVFSEGRISLESFNVVEHVDAAREILPLSPDRGGPSFPPGPIDGKLGRDDAPEADILSASMRRRNVGGTQIGPGTVALVAYELFDAEGEGVEASEPANPLVLLFGYGQASPALERGLDGLSVGDSREVVLPAEEAFGSRDPAAIIEVDRAELPADVEAGDEFEAERDGRCVPLKVLEVSTDTVVLDTNHPLAGQRVRLRVVVQAVRPATAEEIEEATARIVETAGPTPGHLLPAEQLLRRVRGVSPLQREAPEMTPRGSTRSKNRESQ